MEVIKAAYIEPYLANATTGLGYQLIRKGYFSLDKDSAPGKLIFNRTVGLKDSFKV
ncbi:hypothetical protein [Pedobacter sp. ASV12]|uniref:hypothetical protein n=1 Tax=Pedobacter sp. ASV12 TaxID=2795120 RepID=UPI00351CB07E